MLFHLGVYATLFPIKQISMCMRFLLAVQQAQYINRQQYLLGWYYCTYMVTHSYCTSHSVWAPNISNNTSRKLDSIHTKHWYLQAPGLCHHLAAVYKHIYY